MKAIIPLTALAGLTSATSLPPYSSFVTTESLMSTLKDLETIAFSNGGNRAFGLPGYAASVDYIYNRASKVRGVKTWKQSFNATFAQTTSIHTKVVGEAEEIYTYGLTYSPSTPPEGLTREVVVGPEGEAGCSASGYPDGVAQGKIVLVRRYRCPDTTTLAARVQAASAAGADAVLVFHDVETLPTAGSLGTYDPSLFHPAGFIQKVEGERIKARVEAGEKVEIYFQLTQTVESRETWNVFAETRWGDPNDVIMLGAHLDSVQAGPGINDDGSGTALILELLNSLRSFPTPHKIRFAWWGAEENGKIGSEHYADNLPASERAKILLYLNFDMVSRGYFGVFDGDGSTHGLAAAPGSDVIESLFHKYMAEMNITVTPAVFTGGSDYASFMPYKIPVGGLHTGTGVAQDPCYHQKCDNYANPNSTVISVNTKAAAGVLSELAVRGKWIIPSRNETVSDVARKEAKIEVEWGQEEGARHTGCGGHDEL